MSAAILPMFRIAEIDGDPLTIPTPPPTWRGLAGGKPFAISLDTPLSAFAQIATGNPKTTRLPLHRMTKDPR